MRFERRWFAGIAVVLLLVLAGGSDARAQEKTRLRWDLIRVQPGAPGQPNTLRPGGLASAWLRLNPRAPDPGSLRITLIGSGTFSPEDPSAVAGGGAWIIQTPDFAFVSFGTYQVTGLVSWDDGGAQTAPQGINQITGTTLGDFRNGLAVFTIAYSDGSRGVLTVSCAGPGAPPNMFEGFIVTKGFVTFASYDPPTGALLDWNRTVFTVLHD